jgi:release factor glutamine methyltransferase
LTKKQHDCFEACLRRRCAGEPLSHILGRREFWSLDFKVNRDVLDPRGDSETLIEAVLAEIPSQKDALRILDCGTGSGCLVLSLLHELPNATAVGVDISSAALDVARENAINLDLDTRVQFLQSNWFNNLAKLDDQHKFDLLISNPPYIEHGAIAGLEKQVRDYDPLLALDGGVKGLDPYYILADQMGDYLKSDGFSAFEFGEGQGSAIRKILKSSGYDNLTSFNDLAGIERVIIIRKC